MPAVSPDEPARRASWSGDANGFTSSHLWSFTPPPDDGTHVSHVKVLVGVTVAILRPLVARRDPRRHEEQRAVALRGCALWLWLTLRQPDHAGSFPGHRWSALSKASRT